MSQDHCCLSTDHQLTSAPPLKFNSVPTYILLGISAIFFVGFAGVVIGIDSQDGEIQQETIVLTSLFSLLSLVQVVFVGFVCRQAHQLPLYDSEQPKSATADDGKLPSLLNIEDQREKNCPGQLGSGVRL